ncbi:MAG: nucleotidyltransferase substrate binding protein [Synechococcaceae cyanobacterium]|nr:nucleotidyltransferase substrate binding protein [Synechococcaceae cyanobacterium]
MNAPAPDVRWRQRFANVRRALEPLEGFFDPPPHNEREQQVLIKAFEYSFELGWMQMVQDRHFTRHTYNQARAEEIAANIQARYLHCFRELRRRLSALEAQGDA